MTQQCALCRLVTSVLSESFSELPLVYSWVGSWSIEGMKHGKNIKKEYNHNTDTGPKIFRNRVSVSISGLLLHEGSHYADQIGLSLALTSSGGPEFGL